MNFVFINHKGGIGKSTLSVNTAFRYAEKKRHLLLVDFDEQKNSLQLFSGYSWDGSSSCYKHNSGFVIVSTGVFPGIVSFTGDIIFDCPPSFHSSNVFIDFLSTQNINIDVWLIPVESRTSILGADTITHNIRSKYPSARIVFVMNRCSSNVLSQKDRLELVRYPGVELYNQVIPQASGGLTKFEQTGGTAVWNIYKGTQCSVRMRDFCDWIIGGCSSRQTFKNSENVDVSNDRNRSVFINTLPGRRRNYGEY
jgi:hypothetical protein